jgi:hypothetical protein
MDLELLADTVEALDVEDLSPELREELTQDVTRAISGTREKVDIVSSTLAYFEAAQAAAISEIERLTKRHAYFARAQSRLEQYCVSVIETSKFTKLEGRISTLSTRQNPPSVVIAEGTVLPERFMRQPATPAPTADKSAIRTSLKHGATIEGCALVATTRLVRA